MQDLSRESEGVSTEVIVLCMDKILDVGFDLPPVKHFRIAINQNPLYLRSAVGMRAALFVFFESLQVLESRVHGLNRDFGFVVSVDVHLRIEGEVWAL